ncbi:MAG: RNA 2',3'-cyclic phosphodiesterase [Dehalococcoidales bacterium]|nr:RNA 2',3'-cyclic phosphodiesterase [Dehalococcoidales bacterium]
MALIRTFMAVELPGELKKELAELEAQLKKSSPLVVRWVDPNSIHITLKFLGEVPEESIEELMLALEESVSGIPPFRLEVRELGAFPNLDRVQVVWVGVEVEIARISRLQQKIEANTEQLGFPRESRAFTPHLTLGRVRNEASANERQRLGKVLAGTTVAALHGIDVSAVSLMKSQLTSAGAIYACLGRAELKAE